MSSPPSASRRQAIRAAALGMIASTIAPRSRARGGDDGLIVRGGEPLNAETPVSSLDSWITPVDRFFVRSHFGPPGETPRAAIEVGGRVKSPSAWEAADLDRLDRIGLAAVLQCSGNGRALFTPEVPGVRWERGAVGNAEWEGVRLADFLHKAGIDPGAKHVQFLGHDRPPNVKTPAYHRSLPIDRAMDPTTLVAIRMNGEPIPRLHGGPFRLIVPGWSGNHWIKWLRSITASDEEAPGFYQRTGYKMPKAPAPPGATVRPEDMEPVTRMNVKSLIVSPASEATVTPGAVEVRGLAWTGAGKVVKVEVAIDGGPWRGAAFFGPDRPWAWRQWAVSASLDPGPHSARARATDSSGEVQPDVSPWNRSGYLWNGIESVSFTVGRS